MPDFPGAGVDFHDGVLSTAGLESPIAQHQLLLGAGVSTAAAWPSNNLAIYCPVIVPMQITVVKMSIVVGAQNGNFDAGIYDEIGNRLTSIGTTAVGAAGVQVFDVADVTFGPGIFYLAGVASTTVTATFLSGSPDLKFCRTHGVRQQATALPLPNPATFANMGSSYIPLVCAHYINATV